MAAQLTLTNGRGGERAFAVDMRGEQLLAGPRFSGQQHTRVRSRDLRGLRDGALERRAAADHFRRVPDQLPKPLVLALEIRSLEGILDDQKHAIAGERFLQKVKCADSRGFDRIADRRVSGNHDRRGRIVGLPERSQQVDAVSVGKPNVQQVQVGADGAIAAPGRRHRIADRDSVAFAFQDQPQRQTDIRLRRRR